MKSYPSYELLAVDLDLHFFDKLSILRQIGNLLIDGSWFVVTDDGQCHLFDEKGNLDDINKLHALHEDYINKSIKKIIIPDSVTSIENYAFYDCYALTSVVIPGSVTNIAESMFLGCNKLTSVTIPDSVKSIGYYAFEFCSSLTNVTIGNSVTIIGLQVFYGCKKLKKLFFKGKTLKQVKAMKNYPWGIIDESIIKAEFE